MLGVGRDLCGSYSPTPLLKQEHLQQAAQDLVQAGLEYLQRRRLHNLPGQPVPVLRHPQREDLLVSCCLRSSLGHFSNVTVTVTFQQCHCYCPGCSTIDFVDVCPFSVFSETICSKLPCQWKDKPNVFNRIEVF